MDAYPDIDQIQNKTTSNAVYFFTDAINVFGKILMQIRDELRAYAR